MALTVFFLLVIAYLAVAASLVYRNPFSGGGFPMFALTYLVFLVGSFFVGTSDVLIAWVGLAIANMLVQYRFVQQQKLATVTVSVLLASLFVWPIQLAAVIHNVRADAISGVEQAEARERIGTLPANIVGTVSYTHHLDIDKGYDAVWLEEYGDLQFTLEAARYDELRIAEGRRLTFTVDEREAPPAIAEGKTLWILDATAGDP